MRNITNKFGNQVMWTLSDDNLSIRPVKGKVKAYIVCAACLSVYTDMLSYLSKYENGENGNIDFGSQLNEETDIAVVLSCQVTDLSIYNDITVMEEIHKRYPDVTIYCGGCLAQRFDIPLPEYVRRMDVERAEDTPLSEQSFKKVDYLKPFWNKNLSDDAYEFEQGNLFRHMYPLKIGAGCHGGCKYCTIRDTRGPSYTADAYTQVREFLEHDDVVLVCDAPSIQQIKDWCHIAERYSKPISFRNVEPPVANACRDDLIALAKRGILKIFHCPIQSLNSDCLKAMNRNVDATFEYVDVTRKALRELGVKVATNIIIDYVCGDVKYADPTKNQILELFDYYGWNPYFDGNFDYDNAKKRYEKYIEVGEVLE